MTEDETAKLHSTEPLKRQLIDEIIESREGYVDRIKKIMLKLEKEENYFKK